MCFVLKLLGFLWHWNTHAHAWVWACERVSDQISQLDLSEMISNKAADEESREEVKKSFTGQ